MEANLIIEGFKFMGLGMGTVFIFLIIMIISMNLMSSFINRFFPEAHASATAPTKKNNNKIIAAVIGAITQHKQG